MIRLLSHAGLVSVLLVAVCAPALLSSCSSVALDPKADGVGSVGLELQVGAGLSIAQVKYLITGPTGFTRTDNLNVTNSDTVSGVISGLPVASGYSLTLTGDTTDGTTSCSGSASFDVAAQQTTRVSVHLICRQSPSTGSVAINGTLNVCPVADGITANPAAVFLGQTIALSATAHDVDSGPAPLSYSWSASSGTLSDPTVVAPSFTCTAPGNATISVTVSDGDTADGCTDQATVTVSCTPTSADVQALLNANCTSCHAGPTAPRGLSLVDVSAVVGVAAVECPGKLRIASGNAAQSYLVDKLLGGAQDGGCFSGKPMPLNKPSLAASDIALISAWINAGAH